MATVVGLYDGEDISLGDTLFNKISDDQCAWAVTDLDGWWGLPDVDVSDDPKTQSLDGSYFTFGRYLPRTISLRGQILPLDGAPNKAVAARSTLNRALAPLARSRVLLTVEEDDPKVSLVQLAGTPLTKIDKTTGQMTFDIVLRAVDPVKYSSVLHTDSTTLASTSSGRSYNKTFYYSYGGKTTDGVIAADNIGSYRSDASFTITGPVTRPRIEHVEQGVFLEFNVVLGIGETLTINTRTKTILFGGASRRNTLTPDSRWFSLTTGLNTIRFSGTQQIPAQVELHAGTNLLTNPSFESTSGTIEMYRNRITNPSLESKSGTVDVFRNLLTNPSFEATSGTVEVFRNLLTNPSFETTSGTVEVWRNVITNPSFETAGGTLEARRNFVKNSAGATSGSLQGFVLAAQWYGGSPNAGTTSWVSGASDGPEVSPGVKLTSYGRKTHTAVGGAANALSWAMTAGVREAVTAGTAWTASLYWRKSNSAALANNLVIAQFYDAATGGTQVVPTVNSVNHPTPAANTWQRVSGTFTVPAGATHVAFVHLINFTSHTDISVGMTVDATGALIEASSALLPYFDHTFSPDSDLAPSATGTPGASPSILTGVRVAMNSSAPYNAVVVQSSQWSASGAGKSLRISSTRSAPGESMVLLHGNFSGLYGLVPGTLYTVMAKVRMTGPVTNDDTGRRLRLRHNSGFINSSQWPNEAGVYDVRFTAMFPVGATEAMIQFNHYGIASDPPIWIDNLAVVAGDYTGAYFDGSTSPDSDLTPAWVGTANASQSTLTGVKVSGVTATAVGQSLQYATGETPVSGARALRTLVTTTGAVGLPVTDVLPASGTTYTLLLRARARTRATTVVPRLRATEGAEVTLPVGEWTEVRMTGVAGTGTVIQSGLLLKDVRGHQSGDLIDIDNVALVEGVYTGPYFDGSTYPEQTRPKLSAWSGALATGKAQAVVIGDSISEGTVSSTAATRWQTLIQKTLAPSGSVFPFIPVFPVAPNTLGFPVTRSGSITAGFTNGLGLRAATMNAGSSATFTFTGTSFKMMYLAQNGTAPLLVSIDGGAATSVATQSTTATESAWASPALTSGAHTVTVSVGTGGNGAAMLSGLLTFNGDETSGVRVIDAAHWGLRSSHLTAERTATHAASVALLGEVNLAIIGIGTNDYSVTALPAYRASIVAQIDAMRSKGFTGSVLLVGMYMGGGRDLATYQPYLDQLESIAAADLNVDYINLRNFMPDVPTPITAPQGEGLFEDGLHPSDSGHVRIAASILKFITPVTADTDLTLAWTGAANASQSVLTAPDVVGVVGSSNGLKVYSSTKWSRSGTKSVRLTPNSESTNTSTPIQGSSVFGMNAGMIAGKTYTLVGTIRLDTPQTGVLSDMARTVRVAHNTVSGWSGAQYIASPQAPNVAGKHEVRLTFTIPTGSTWAMLMLMNGASAGNGDVWWDNVALVEGEYAGPFFDGANAPELRRNAFINPSAEISSSAVSYGSSVTVTKADSTWTSYGTSHLRIEGNSSTTLGGSQINQTVPVGRVQPGQWWAASIALRQTSEGGSASAPYARVAAEFYNGTTAISQVLGPWFSPRHSGVIDDTFRHSIAGQVPASADRARLVVWFAKDATIGSLEPSGVAPDPGFVAFADGWIDAVGRTEAEALAAVATYFDGSYPGGSWTGGVSGSQSVLTDTDLTLAWSGAANASQSVLTAPDVVGVVGSSTALKAYSSSQWAGSATSSVRLTPVSSDPYSYTSLQGSSVFGMNAGMVAGKTYTVLGTVRLDTPQTGSLHAMARTLQAVYNTSSGWAGAQYVYSNQAPNIPGQHDVRLTFTVPSNATWAMIRPMNGASAGNGDIWWDKFMLVEGVYSGPYFDGGASPDADMTAKWVGTAHASESTLTAVGVSGVTTNVLAPRISSTRWSASGTKSIRIIPLGSSNSYSAINIAPMVTGGKTYTLLGTLRLETPQVGTLSSQSRMLVTRCISSVETLTAESAAAPNTAGVHLIRHTFSTPSGVLTAAEVFLRNGASAGNGDVWWDNLALIEGEYEGEYFDGDFPYASWSGASHASSSVRPYVQEVPETMLQLSYRDAWID